MSRYGWCSLQNSWRPVLDIASHLSFLGVLCTAIMAPAAAFDAVLRDETKQKLYSHIRRRNLVFIKNRRFLFDLLEKIFNSKRRDTEFYRTRITIVIPSLKRFALIHFALVTIAAWVFIPGTEPFFHEAHHNAERTGWIIGNTQIHIMILVEWISLYLCTLILSFPLDYVSAAKTLTIAHSASSKKKLVRLLLILLDIALTVALVCLSLFGLAVLLFVFGIDLPEEIYRFLGGAPIWLSHEGMLLPRLEHAAVVMASITVLVILVSFSMHIASMMWFMLDKVRELRFFAVQHLKLKKLPFTIAGIMLCIISITFYSLFAAIL